MKSLLALFAAFCLVASPALAGITQIVGSGTGGSIGSASSTTSLTPFSTAAVTANVPAGSLIVVTFDQRSANNTGWSCTDTASIPNTYTQATTSLGTGDATAIFYAIAGASGNLVNGTSVVTCHGSGSATTAAFTVTAFSGVTASPLDQSGSNNGTSTALSPVPASATATLACSAANSELAVGTVSGHNAVTNGGTGTFTSTGSPNIYGVGAFQILSSNSGVQWSNSITQTSATWAGSLATFKASTCNLSSSHTLLLTGVGE